VITTTYLSVRGVIEEKISRVVLLKKHKALILAANVLKKLHILTTNPLNFSFEIQ